MAEIRKSLADRFEAKVERIPFMGCWVWMGAVHERGYGIIGLGGRHLGNERAHRTAYRLYRGEIPKDKIMLHKCGNANCVNPWHLEFGTHKDNAQDTVRMGRLIVPNNKGTNAKWAKLDEDKVLEIMKAKGGVKGTGTTLARKFNVSKSAIYAIWVGKNWKK
tara:strand:- start:873 stop:1358 length:486 start_codon:yes stop_codon:yes gene_type:complete